jgi:hypothetical protein
LKCQYKGLKNGLILGLELHFWGQKERFKKKAGKAGKARKGRAEHVQLSKVFVKL